MVLLMSYLFCFSSMCVLVNTAVNSDLYGRYAGAMPVDFITLLYLCLRDLNGEQSCMGSSVSLYI